MEFKNEVFTTREAAAIWGRPRNTIQAACLRGVFKVGIDCRKSGRDWLVLKSSLIDRYGQPPNKSLLPTAESPRLAQD